MLDYYNKRLQEYETVYTKPERQADLNALLARLQTDVSSREVLELACGTGWWTERLATHASSWTATDADPGALDISSLKLSKVSVLPRRSMPINRASQRQLIACLQGTGIRTYDLMSVVSFLDQFMAA